MWRLPELSYIMEHQSTTNDQRYMMTWPCTVSLEDMIQFVYIHCSFQTGWSPLHFASAYGHTSIVDHLIKSGSLVDLQTKVQWVLWDSTPVTMYDTFVFKHVLPLHVHGTHKSLLLTCTLSLSSSDNSLSSWYRHQHIFFFYLITFLQQHQKKVKCVEQLAVVYKQYIFYYSKSQVIVLTCTVY